MPIYLKDKSEFPELEKFKSVLIVPCRFCPAASMAVRRNKPYFEFLRRFLKTGSYEQLLDTIKSNLEKKGIKTDVFKSRWPHQFVVCMWTNRRREKLLKRADKYEAVVVMGCEAAVQTVYDALETTSCQVLQGMRSEGVMTIKPSFSLLGNISLDLEKIIPLVHQNRNSLPWVIL
ncbi:MAG: hypothetical protein KJO26_09000 [Deltaproteobacteria bacterium]|nr:hypothetical protein [Deltaproteobacteria bacterium]NNK86562.1 hypothetical protein [Desulfobacterales bacterium]